MQYLIQELYCLGNMKETSYKEIYFKTLEDAFKHYDTQKNMQRMGSVNVLHYTINKKVVNEKYNSYFYATIYVMDRIKTQGILMLV